MKKSTIYLLSSGLILWLFYLVIEPLGGMVYMDSTNKNPKEFISAFMKSLDRSDEIDRANLEGINHIKIIGKDGNIYSSIEYADSTKITAFSQNQMESYNYKKVQDSLIISIDAKKNRVLKMTLNPKATYTLTFDHVKGSFSWEPGDSTSHSFSKVDVLNGSDLRLTNRSRDNNIIYNPLKFQVSGKSKVELNPIAFKKVDLQLNSGLFILENGSHIDSLQADLQGLSNIIVGHYPKDKRVGDLQLSGDLDYYQKRKPK